MQKSQKARLQPLQVHPVSFPRGWLPRDSGTGFWSRGALGSRGALHGREGGAHLGGMNQQALPPGPEDPVRKVPDPSQGVGLS